MFGLENNTHTKIQIGMVRGCVSPLAYRYKNIPGEYAHMFVNKMLLGASVNPDSVST